MLDVESQALSPAHLLAHRRPTSTPTELATTLLTRMALLSIHTTRLFTLDVDHCLDAVQLIDVAGHAGVGGRRIGLVQ